jgi:hypothetical protein
MNEEEKTMQNEKRFRLQFDISYGGKSVEIDGESQTVPEMNLTVRQLLENHVRGKGVPTKEPLFFETQIPTINDLTDLAEYKTTLEDALQSVNDYIINEKQLSEYEANRNTTGGTTEQSSDANFEGLRPHKETD